MFSKEEMEKIRERALKIQEEYKSITTEVTYLDDNMKVCDAKDATRMVVREYKDGKFFRETFGTVGSNSLKNDESEEKKIKKLLFFK